jgi:hypothetical protein
MKKSIMGNIRTKKERNLPPYEYTTADKYYQVGKKKATDSIKITPSSPVRRSNGKSGASRAIR